MLCFSSLGTKILYPNHLRHKTPIANYAQIKISGVYDSRKFNI